MLPTVSVIIATKNEEKHIESCLLSIKEQSYPLDKIELIVIDNDSSDRTREIAKDHTKKVFNLLDDALIKNIKNFRGAQLNYGVENAQGDVIFFPDADMTFDIDLLKESVEMLKGFNALYVPEIVIGNGLLGKIRRFERSFYNETCIDAVRIVNKDIYLKVGGFDVKNIPFAPDDWDFTKSLKEDGVKFGITYSSLYHHEEGLTLWTYLSKKSQYTGTFDSYITKWGKHDPDIQKQFSAYYRLIGVFIENKKWKTLLMNPHLTAGMLLLRCCVGVVFLLNKL